MAKYNPWHEGSNLPKEARNIYRELEEQATKILVERKKVQENGR